MSALREVLEQLLDRRNLSEAQAADQIPQLMRGMIAATLDRASGLDEPALRAAIGG